MTWDADGGVAGGGDVGVGIEGVGIHAKCLFGTADAIESCGGGVAVRAGAIRVSVMVAIASHDWVDTVETIAVA